MFICFFVSSCQRTSYSYFKSDDLISMNSYSSFNEENSSIISSSFMDESNQIKIEVIDKNHVVFKYNTKEIDYFVDHLIDGTTYKMKENLYINEKRNEIGFLIINNGKLIIQEATLCKKGDAYEPRNAVQYGKNSLITIIGEGQVEITKCAVNIFSKGSSFIHLMHGGKAIINNVDIVVTDEYSCAYSYYNVLELVNAKNCFIFIDNEKSEECVTFYDE